MTVPKASLSNPEWAAVKPLLAGSQGMNDRRVVAGIRWALKTGLGWRNIPGVVGSGWTTFYNRHAAWKRSGLWEKIEKALDSLVTAAAPKAKASAVAKTSARRPVARKPVRKSARTAPRKQTRKVTRDRKATRARTTRSPARARKSTRGTRRA